MTDLLRKVVSGHKARFHDSLHGISLDLVYVTDRLLIMGYPATGIESIYRNRRKDVLRFLELRHGRKWKIFNFCPRTENEYPSSVFYDQVSRYPFPDHHVPPLSLIPLFVDDISNFLDADPENVAVVHCKAGKGRSGTMAVSYLISLPQLPSPPKLERNYSDTSTKSPTKSKFTVVQRPTDSDLSTKNNDNDGVFRMYEDGEPARTHSDDQRDRAQTLVEGLEDQFRTGNPEPKSPEGHGGVNFQVHSDDHARIPDSADGPISSNGGLGGGDDVAETKSVNLPKAVQGLVPTNAVSRFRENEAPAGISDGDGKPGVSAPGPAAREALAMAERLSHVFQLHTQMRMKPPRAREGSNADRNGAREPHKDVQEGGGDKEEGGTASKPAKPKKERMGVSIPSQRRWVGYWARILEGFDPRPRLSIAPKGSLSPARLIRLTRISLLTIPPTPPPSTASAAKRALAAAAGLVVGDGSRKMSVQIARYADACVENVEKVERSRFEQGRRKEGMEAFKNEEIEWEDDKPLIVYFASFGEEERMEVGEPAPEGQDQQQSYAGGGDSSDDVVLPRPVSSTDPRLFPSPTPPIASPTLLSEAHKQLKAITGGPKDEGVNDKKILIRTFYPHGRRSDSERVAVQQQARSKAEVHDGDGASVPGDGEEGRTLKAEKRGKEGGIERGLVIDADREVMIKVLLGETGKKHSSLPDIVSLCWLWFIPSFESAPPSTPSPDANGEAPASAPNRRRNIIRFSSRELDFVKKPFGIQSLEVEFEWIMWGEGDGSASSAEEGGDEAEGDVGPQGWEVVSANSDGGAFTESEDSVIEAEDPY